jgi:hypothetical protein
MGHIFGLGLALCTQDPENSSARERVHSCIIIYDVLKSRVETKKKKKTVTIRCDSLASICQHTYKKKKKKRFLVVVLLLSKVEGMEG